MTVEKGISRIQELFDMEEDLERLLEDFGGVYRASPLSNAQEDTFINEYKNSIANMKRIHSNVISSYLDWIIDTRAT